MRLSFRRGFIHCPKLPVARDGGVNQNQGQNVLLSVLWSESMKMSVPTVGPNNERLASDWHDGLLREGVRVATCVVLVGSSVPFVQCGDQRRHRAFGCTSS